MALGALCVDEAPSIDNVDAMATTSASFMIHRWRVIILDMMEIGYIQKPMRQLRCSQRNMAAGS